MPRGLVSKFDLHILIESDTESDDPIGDALRADAVAYWKLENVNDATGRGNTLTNNSSSTFASGKVNNAVSLNGSSQYLNRASNSDMQVGDNTFVIALWVYLASAPPDDYMVMMKSTGTEDEYYLQVFSSRVFHFYIPDRDFNYLAVVSPQVPLETWTFMMFWHDAGADTVNISINNGAIASESVTPGQPVTDAPVYIGSNLGIDHFYHGSLDEIGFWKRLLTSEERAYLYNAGAGRSLYP